IAAAIIKGHDLFESLKTSVMKIWPTQSDVAQTRRAELPDVVGVAGDLESPGVFGLRSHADVVKLIVAEQRTGVTSIAPTAIEKALAALFGGAQRRDVLRR